MSSQPQLPWQKSVPTLPKEPGVYWFSDNQQNILYVGKAKNLKNRVSSYQRLNQLSSLKQKMVQIAEKIQYQTLASEIEALLIEAELIRLHQPEYNILLKDDKSRLYLVIEKRPFSALKVVRKSDLKLYPSSATTLGPYASAYKLKQVLNIARRVFPWCDQAEKNNTLNKKKHRACFNYHLNLCSGACIGQVEAKDYQTMIDQLIQVLKGKTGALVKSLSGQMQQLADELRFEEAAAIKQKIELIQEVTQPQYRLRPDLILPTLHSNNLKQGLDQLKKILLDHGVIASATQLNRIEGYDVSNLFGQQAAVSMVVCENGQMNKSAYRLFNIKDISSPNDYAMMKQAIKRRLNHPEWLLPDLILVDGGKGQIRAALRAFYELQQKPVGLLGLAKNPDRLIVPLPPVAYNQPQLQYKELILKSNHPSLHLLQKIRDESHRFAKKQHLRLRRRSTFALDR